MKSVKIYEYLPKYYDKVVETQTIVQSELPEFENLYNGLNDVENQLNISTLTEYGLNRWENNILKIIPKQGATFEDRCGIIQSYLIGQYKLNASTIQELADAYNYGKVSVNFNSPNIKIKLLDIFGEPDTYNEFRNYISLRKPSHLGLTVDFRYMTYGELQPYTHELLSGYSHQDVMNGIFV